MVNVNLLFYQRLCRQLNLSRGRDEAHYQCCQVIFNFGNVCAVKKILHDSTSAGVSDKG